MSLGTSAASSEWSPHGRSAPRAPLRHAESFPTAAAAEAGDYSLLHPATGPPADGVRRDRLACTYCRHPLTADSFEYWSEMRRLVSANTHPICERRTTVRASTWIRLNESEQPEYPGTRTRP